MRNTILAITLVLTFVTGQPQERPPKSHPADVDAGRIAWFDITTSNLPQSKEFYGKLFDWKFTPLEENNFDFEIQNADDEVAKAEDRLLDRMVAGEEYDRQVKAAEISVKQVEAVANGERQVLNQRQAIATLVGPRHQCGRDGRQHQRVDADHAQRHAPLAGHRHALDFQDRACERHLGMPRHLREHRFVEAAL